MAGISGTMTKPETLSFMVDTLTVALQHAKYKLYYTVPFVLHSSRAWITCAKTYSVANSFVPYLMALFCFSFMRQLTSSDSREYAACCVACILEAMPSPYGYFPPLYYMLSLDTLGF